LRSMRLSCWHVADQRWKTMNSLPPTNNVSSEEIIENGLGSDTIQ
jgi:hypothetical protein